MFDLTILDPFGCRGIFCASRSTSVFRLHRAELSKVRCVGSIVFSGAETHEKTDRFFGHGMDHDEGSLQLYAAVGRCEF